MASAMRKMAVYLGLVEDDHRYQDKYDSYGEYEEYEESGLSEGPDEADPRASKDDYGGYQVPEWRPEQPTDLARITTLHPRTYNEARTIGEHFREGTPVIMNLTEMVDSDAKRLVDFAAGLIFGLRGSLERVTNKVFLLSPANVEVTASQNAASSTRASQASVMLISDRAGPAGTEGRVDSCST
jgi:cell division inhibitor SepF